MAARLVDPDVESKKRDLRLRIGRLRRRLDGRVYRTRRHLGRLTSWRTYVRRYPGYALLAALGLGMSVSSTLGGGRWARLLATRMIRRVGDGLGRGLWAELVHIWEESEPER